MRVLRFSFLLLVIVSVAVGSLRADSSIQWGEETADVAVNRSLLWKKPKASSDVVTADRAASIGKPIRQVQFQEALPTVPPPTGTTNPSSLFDTLPPTPESSKQEIPTPLLPSGAPLQTPANTEGAPATGTTPAPSPSDPSAQLPLPPRKVSKEIDCSETAPFKSIRDISYDIRPMPGELPKECPLTGSTYTGRYHNRTCFFWTASAVCTKGAYFENVQLERYGHSLCPALEPIFSGVRFFVTIPLLPYKMGLIPPNECVYTLGHYRVGSCAPYMLDPLPVSVRAVLFQAAAVGGAVAIIP